MIRSMTGYARVESQGPWGRLSWELRSVNHRYLDFAVRLPDELRSIENDVRRQAGAKLSRGKIEAGLYYQRQTADLAPLVLDSERLRQLQQALVAVRRGVGARTAPDPMRVLAWPGVIKTETPDFTPLRSAALGLFERALEDFIHTRTQEGERLSHDLLERCAFIEDGVDRIRARLPEVRTLWLERLRARCQTLGGTVEPARLEQEVVLAAQRLDVEEELARLSAHLAEVRHALSRPDAVGRRLDFLMQELNREANTLASKSQDVEVSRLAVEIKVAIEQLREQVQNIE
ncbi:MAG: YicC family protein [Nevskiales bacterium]|nr:YicC family protein [Nevskiales bacterium]